MIARSSALLCLLAAPLMATGSMSAEAARKFAPFSFFPDRNDHVQIQITTETGQSSTMAFNEGPGFKFTSTSFLKPPHSVLARTGETAFPYLPFDARLSPGLAPDGQNS